MKRLIIGFLYFVYSFAFATDCIVGKTELKATDQIYNLANSIARINVELNRCAYSNPNRKPKNIINLFEGRNGFTKELLVAFKNFQSLDSKCEKNSNGEYVIYFPDGKWMMADHLKGYFDSLVSPKTSGTAVALKNLIVEGFCNSGINFSETEVYLWGEDEPIELAYNCMKKNYWNRYDGINTPKSIIMGYSRGGARAIEFANLLKNKGGIKTDIGMTIDPVPQKLGQTLAKIPAALAGVALKSHVPDSFQVPADTRWINYWQEVDNRWDNAGTITGSAGLHGSPVSGAIVNKEIKAIVPEGKNNGGHWRIFFDQEIKNSVSNLLKNEILK